MYRNVSKQINERTMELAKEFKPNLDEFNNNKEFMELYDSGITFCQVFLYDRHNGYTGNRTNFNFDLDRKAEFENAMKFYKEKLEEFQKIAVAEFGVSDYDSRTYYYNNRVADDFGYCHTHVHVRNQEREELEERERWNNYREEDEVSCSRCGDGGCPHCEPHRFI